MRITRLLAVDDDSDSFERAIHAMAPVCEHRNRKIVGHGVQPWVLTAADRSA